MRTLVFLALLYLAWRAIRSRFPLPGASAPPNAVRGGGSEMIQDPQCKIFFPKDDGVFLDDSGTGRYFCSEACRDAYVASRSASR